MYTYRDMERNHGAYERNFGMLLKTCGTPKHKVYVKEERRLNNFSKIIGRDLRRQKKVFTTV